VSYVCEERFNGPSISLLSGRGESRGVRAACWRTPAATAAKPVQNTCGCECQQAHLGSRAPGRPCRALLTRGTPPTCGSRHAHACACAPPQCGARATTLESPYSPVRKTRQARRAGNCWQGDGRCLVSQPLLAGTGAVATAMMVRHEVEQRAAPARPRPAHLSASHASWRTHSLSPRAPHNTQKQLTTGAHGSSLGTTPPAMRTHACASR
jgi:hypothetical protein